MKNVAKDTLRIVIVTLIVGSFLLLAATACKSEDGLVAQPAPEEGSPVTPKPPVTEVVDEAGAAKIVSPPDGSHLPADTVEFEWTGNCSKYRLTLSQVDYGLSEIFDSGSTTDTLVGVPDLPWNGEPLFAVLYCDGDASYEKYTYTAWFYDEITSPAPGSHLDDTAVTFEWTGRSKAGQYCVDIGSLPGDSDIDGKCTSSGNELSFTGLPDDESELYLRLWYQKTSTSCRMFVDCPYTDVSDQPPREPYTAYKPDWDRSDIILTEVSLADTTYVTTQAEDHSLPEAVVDQGGTVRFWVTILFDSSHSPNEQLTFDPQDVATRAVLENYDATGDYYFSPGDMVSVTVEYGPQSSLRDMYPLPTLAMDDGAITGLLDAHYADEDRLPLPGLDPDDLLEIEHSDILYSAPLTQFGAKEQSELVLQLARVSFLQRTLNNHVGAVPEAYLRVSGPLIPITDMLLFTFSLDTEGLKPGLWQLKIDLDPDDKIAEYDEGNNSYLQQPVFRLVNDPAVGATVGDDGDWPRGVNPCPDFVMEGEVPIVIKAEMHLYQDFLGRLHPLYTEFFSGMDFLQEREMRIAEILGPHGTGMYWSSKDLDMISFYPSGHPNPEDIRNIFLFTVGQASCGAPNLTGIKETACESIFANEREVNVRFSSYPGNLLYYEPFFADMGYYSRDDTLLVVVPSHRMHIWPLQWHEDSYAPGRYRIVDALFRYLAARTGNFENVENIVLGGKSRGGHLVTYLGHMIKQLRETPNSMCIYEEGVCWDARLYADGSPQYLSGMNFRENNPRLTIVTIEPSGFPLSDYGHEIAPWCLVPYPLAGMSFAENGVASVPVANWDLEHIFPKGSGPYGDHTENLAVLNLSGDGWSNSDDTRIVAAWAAGYGLSAGSAVPSISIDYTTDKIGDAMAEVTDALDGSFYTHWSMPDYSHFEIDSVWRRQNGMSVFNWIMGKAFDAAEEVENMQQCAVCVKSPLSGSDLYDTGSTKRFSRYGRAFAQRFRGTGNADREGFLQDVTVALHTPAGEGVQALIYADGAQPGDGALLAQSEVVRMRPPMLSFEFRLPFAYDQQVMLDPNQYYWLVITFVDVDETSAAERGDLYYYYDPDDSHTDPEWRMAREYWDDVYSEWGWDSGPGNDDGVLRFAVNYCKRQPWPCHNGLWSAHYFDTRRAGFQWDLEASPVAQRFVAERSGPVNYVKLYLAGLEPEEEVEVCIHTDADWEPSDAKYCTSRGDLSIGGTRKGAEFYYYYREDQPYVFAGNTYWVSVRMLSGSGQVEYFDVTYHSGDYEDGWFAVWDETEERWANHAGGANNKDMWFGVYVCDD